MALRATHSPRPSSRRSSRVRSEGRQGGPLVAVDAEEAVGGRGPEDLLEDGGGVAEPELAARRVDPPLEQDQLAQERAGDQGDVGEIEDEPNRAAVVGQDGGDLVRDVTDRPLV